MWLLKRRLKGLLSDWDRGRDRGVEVISWGVVDVLLAEVEVEVEVVEVAVEVRCRRGRVRCRCRQGGHGIQTSGGLSVCLSVCMSTGVRVVLRVSMTRANIRRCLDLTLMRQ